MHDTNPGPHWAANDVTDNVDIWSDLMRLMSMFSLLAI
jgi:hypothetical protein